MPRPEKVQAVADIKERIEGSTAVFLAEYAGLSVTEQQQLRRGLRAAGGELKIMKMTLARIAAEELGHDELIEGLSGPTAIAFASGDAAAAAKVMRDFAKDHTQLILKGGLLDGEPLTPERVEQLAELDSRDVLLAKVAGAFQAPMATMAGLMAALPRNLASMMSQLIEKLPPAEEAAPEPEAAAEPETPEAVPDEAAAVEGPVSETEAPEEPADDAGSEASDDAEATTDEDTAESAEEE
jgi:large subunit ribosomal protein L10